MKLIKLTKNSMNILIVCDVPDWAIGSLTKTITKYNTRHTFHIVYAHPKEAGRSVGEIRKVLKENNIDLWHGQYWNSAWQVAELCPELNEIPSLLTHHNHKHLDQKDWSKYFDGIAVPTKYGQENLSKYKTYLIPHGINLDEFSYVKERDDDGNTVGYVGRILAHKNIHKICEISKKNGYKVLGSGYIDKPNYYNEKVAQYRDTILEFHGGIGRNQKNDWDAKNELYKRMTVFVMYSTGEVETGTLPLLEAMARGIPILATEQGMARDLIEDGKNGLLFNEDNFEEKLNHLMSSKELQEKFRRAARKTIQQYSEEKMAIRYAKAYDDLVKKDELVSVIIPTCDRSDTLDEIIEAVAEQSYSNVELIVVDDSKEVLQTGDILNSPTYKVVEEAKKKYDLTIQYVGSYSKVYGLAKARNHGIVEARGNLLVFADDRLRMDKHAVINFAKCTKGGQWNYGQKQVKGVASKNIRFVENFSAVHKSDLVQLGMFNERIVWYGGMTQDMRNRCKMNGIEHNYVSGAIAHAIRKTPKMKRPEDVWKAKLLLWKLYGEA